MDLNLVFCHSLRFRSARNLNFDLRSGALVMVQVYFPFMLCAPTYDFLLNIQFSEGGLLLLWIAFPYDLFFV